MRRTAALKLSLWITIAALVGCQARGSSQAPGITALPLAPTVARATPAASVPVSRAVIAALVESFAAELMYYQTPGGALAIVQNGAVIHAQGFGTRNLATGAPFTPQTQFRTGSTGKSMTALMVAQMIDQGVLAWDTPVLEVLPDFRTRNAGLTARLTIRDLMGMGTGLESSETNGGSTIDTLLAEIARQPVVGPYREHFSYNNELFAAAAYAALAAVDEPPLVEAYAAYMTQQVFDPIGMPSAVLTDEPCQLSDNFAESYSYGLAPTLGNPQTLQEPVEAVHLGALGPAGGFWVNVDDMSRYLLTQLSGGLTPDGIRIVSAASLAETWAAGVAVAPNPPGAELYHYLPYQQAHYGLGWITTTYRDIPIRHHGGGIGGYRTMIGVLPEFDAGLVLFTNGGGYGVTDGGLLLHFAELMYGLEPQALGDTHRRYEQEVRSLLTPVLGSFDGGWRLLLRDGRLWLIGADSEHQLWVDAATPGVSITASSASLTGTLTLQGEGGLVVLTFGDGTRVRRLGP